jgi:hypothetical protein
MAERGLWYGGEVAMLNVTDVVVAVKFKAGASTMRRRQGDR